MKLSLYDYEILVEAKACRVYKLLVKFVDQGGSTINIPAYNHLLVCSLNKYYQDFLVPWL